MTTKVQKWGHSLGIRIPKLLAEEIGLREQVEVELSLTKGSLVVRPVRKPALTLEELLAGISDENLHDEVLTGPPVGREAW